jgi:glucose/arabinose dehydrogenase
MPTKALRLIAVVIAVTTACKRDKSPVRSDPPPEVAEPAPSPGPSPADATPDPSLGPVSTELVAVPAEIAATVGLEQIGQGFARPLALEIAPGDETRRLFVVEQRGTIQIWRDGVVDKAPFLDIRRQVSRNHEERGLLGLAFHPDYAKSGRLFVNFTNRAGDTRVVEYRVDSADPDRVKADSAVVWLELEQPWANHNGGGLEFGPDGKLYIGTGDGGAADDPLGAGQDKKTLLAKMLRLDVDTPKSRPVIVQWGLRNPWRYHFDPKTGDLYIGDVGQNLWEWVNVAPGGRLDGINWGWNITEGSRCFQNKPCDPNKFAAPAVEYDHKTGCSITGGEVYRGAAIPAISGHYFYADYCTGIVRSFRWASDGVRQHWDWKPVLDPNFRLANISSFGHDHDGELYLISLNGPIYKVVPKK